jgi:4-oxalocrotonate tautomerase
MCEDGCPILFVWAIVPPPREIGTTMPEIIVYCAEGRTPEQKKGLMKDLTEAMVKNFNVDAGVVTVQIVEAPKINKAKGGIPFSER